MSDPTGLSASDLSVWQRELVAHNEALMNCCHEWAEWAERNGMTVSAAQTRKVIRVIPLGGLT